MPVPTIKTKRHRPIFLPLLAFLFLAPVTQAQTAADRLSMPAYTILTLEECVNRALENNFTVEIQSFAPLIAEDGVTIARSQFDPSFDITTTTGVNQQPNAQSALDGAPGPRTETWNSRVGVTKRFITGTQVGVSTRLNRREDNSRNTLINPAYNSDVVLSVSQPLLRGAGIGINRANIDRSELDFTRSIYEYRSAVANVIRDTETAYYRLVFAREQLEVRRLGLQLAERLLEENRIRKQTGVATDLNVLTAEVGVANQRRQLLLAEQQVRQREDDLLALIGRFEFDTALGTTPMGDFSVPRPNIEASYARAQANQPDLLALQTRIEQLEIEMAQARNQRLPSVDLDGALGVNARDRVVRSSIGDLSSGDGYNWQFGLSLRMPWGLHAENARYRQARLQFNRENLRLMQLNQNILAQVRAAVRSVETNQESVSLSALTTRLSEQQYELERARFDAGLSTSRFVLDAQADLDQARVNEVQARVDLRIAYTDLQRLEGTLLEQYHVEFRH